MFLCRPTYIPLRLTSVISLTSHSIQHRQIPAKWMSLHLEICCFRCVEKELRLLRYDAMQIGRLQLNCDGTRWRTEEKWRGNWRMEWVASTLHTTSEHGLPITLVNIQNVSVTKIVDSSSIQRAEIKYGIRIQFFAIVVMIHEVWLKA